MQISEFESLLDSIVQELSEEVQILIELRAPKVFENRVREALDRQGKTLGLNVNFEPHPHVFPDIVIGEFGVEVKVNSSDSWRSVANSVFEGTRDSSVLHIYIVFGKMGGVPEVKWGRYEECVMHVRTSHVPRFELEIGSKKSLFVEMGVSYEKFSQLAPEEKMLHVRKYARGRLKEGERLWWLNDNPDQPNHSLPMQVKVYMTLAQAEKRKLRAEASILCPEVVKPSRVRNKYNSVVSFLLTYHGVLCPQARDLFSAGSVAMRTDQTRGGNFILRALQDIEAEMIEAANSLEDGLFIEYWGESIARDSRIDEWLKRADAMAKGWSPSEHLFLKRRS